MSEQYLPIEQQGDTRGPVDTHGQDQPPVEERFVGGESAQPDAVDRGDRQDHTLTPAEERQALNERMKARRDADREDRVRLYDEQGAPQPQYADEQEQHQQDYPQQAPAEEQRKYRVRYNHADLWLTEDEMARQAQIGMATGDKLAEINRTLAELRQARDNAPRPEPAHQAGLRNDTGQEQPPRTRGTADLRQLAENIQTGDADDGVSALETYKSIIQDEIRREQPRFSPDEVADRVEERLQSRQAEQSFRRYFSERHPEVVGRLGLQVEAERRLHQEMINELRILRRPDGKMLNDQELAPALQDVNTAMKWGAIYALQGVRRYDGNPMANPVQLMDYAVDATKYEYGFHPSQRQQPQQAYPDQTRQNRIRDEKRNLYEPRPAQTGYRQGGQGFAARMTPEQKRSAAVAQRRQATGFDRIT